MAYNHQLWIKTMEETYGPEWRKIMAMRGRKGGKVRVKKGFAKLNAEERKAMSEVGIQARSK